MNSYFVVDLVQPGSEPQRVEAHKIEVSSSGALILLLNSGSVCRVFAPGTWMQVRGF